MPISGAKRLNLAHITVIVKYLYVAEFSFLKFQPHLINVLKVTSLYQNFEFLFTYRQSLPNLFNRQVYISRSVNTSDNQVSVTVSLYLLNVSSINF
jgi:hypothetical protein